MHSDPTTSIATWLKSNKKSYLLSSLYVFAKEGLGYRDLNPRAHGEMCELLETLAAPAISGDPHGTQHKCMLLVPRGCLKSTIGVVALTLWVLCHNNNARILLDSHEHGRSKDLLRSIKQHLEGTAEGSSFKEVFGDWVDDRKWSETAIIIKPRTTPYPDPSVDTAGVDKAKTGGHYDLIIMDDLHTEKNITSIQMIDKVYDHIQNNFPILNPYGSALVIGTRWDFRDSYGRIEKRERENVKMGKEPSWDILIRKAWWQDGSLYFPEKLGTKQLDGLRYELPEGKFANFYLNEPIEDTARVFKSDYFRFYKGEYSIDYVPYLTFEDGRKVPVRVHITWDPKGLKTTAASDFHGLIVNLVDPEGKWYIHEAIQAKGQASEILDLLVYLIQEYQPRVLSIEDVQSQELWIPMLQERLKPLNINVPIHYFKPKNFERKSQRIESLEPKFRARMVHIHEGCADLVEQLEMYPQVLHDDLLDSLAQQREVARPANPNQLAPMVEAEDDFDAPVEKKTRDRLKGTWVGY